MKYLLIWTIAAMTANGPAVIQSKERGGFPDQAKCEEFAKAHTARMADYTRGLLHLDWDGRVSITHRCIPTGQQI